MRTLPKHLAADVEPRPDGRWTDIERKLLPRDLGARVDTCRHGFAPAPRKFTAPAAAGTLGTLGGTISTLGAHAGTTHAGTTHAGTMHARGSLSARNELAFSPRLAAHTRHKSS